MNYYELETHMFDRHHDMVRKAEARRLVTDGRDEQAPVARARRPAGLWAAVGGALRARLVATSD